jgi:hypothetical protein
MSVAIADGQKAAAPFKDICSQPYRLLFETNHRPNRRPKSPPKDHDLNETNAKYTCNEYRQEMLLLALCRQLHTPGISETRKKDLQAQIRDLEAQMDMD